MRSSLLSRWLPDALTALGLALAPFILPALGFSPDTMARVLVFGVFGLGFDLLFGYGGMLSFGQSAFFGTGGFVTAYLLVNAKFPYVMLALLIGTIASAIAGWLVGLIALKRTGIYFSMITVAIAEVFFFMENSPLADYTGGENGIAGVPSPTFQLGGYVLKIGPGWTIYGFLAVSFLIGLIIARRIVHSPVGHVLVAIRENPLRAAAVGHNVHAYKLLVFVIAAAYAGFAGGLLGMMQSYMPPEAFTFDTSGQLVMQTVIGGAGTLFGPLVGAAVWLYLRDFLQGTLGLGAAWKLALGVAFVVLVMFLRRGVIGGVLEALSMARGRSAPPSPDDAPAAPASRSFARPASAPPPAARSPQPQGQPLLQTQAISKRYGGLMANRDISFSLGAGELRGIIGPNGAGKSTFFKMLTCEVAPTSGTIMFDGRDITGLGVTEVCQLGLTKSYQVNQLFTRLTVRENVAIAALARLRGPLRFDLWRDAARVPGLGDEVEEALRSVRLETRADRLVSELAYGEKRRLEIGIALAAQPRLLLLDEPLAGMSPSERVETVQLLKSIQRGRTMVVIDHDMDAIFELAERITVLSEGSILVEGTPDEIKADKRVQEAYLGGIDTL